MVAVARRTVQARALVCSSALKAACTVLEAEWAQLTEAAESKGIKKESLPDQINVAMETVECVQVALRDFDGDVHAALTPQQDEHQTVDVVTAVVANLASLLPAGACGPEDLAKMKMALESVAKSIAGALAKCRIALEPANITNLVCYSSATARRLPDGQAMNVDWTLEFPPAGALYDSATMTDDDNELEWRLDGGDEVTPVPSWMRDTNVVVLTTMPGIPHQFGGAKTVVHRVRDLTASVRHKVEPPRANQALASTPFSSEPLPGSFPVDSGETTQFEPSTYWDRCQKLQAVLERLMNFLVAARKCVFPTNGHQANVCNWEARKAASEVLQTRIFNWFSRNIAPNEALQQLVRTDSMIASLDTVADYKNIDERIDLILQEHRVEVQREFDALACKNHVYLLWELEYAHNWLEWYRLFLDARAQQYVILFPHHKSRADGVIKCVDHHLDCNGIVAMALFPNLISPNSWSGSIQPCAGYCVHAFVAREAKYRQY
ncbi:hypothetical protein AMAG_14120 [Allomyces macrogynus ATCC 38327]|uniref:Uncharacterized protein n=1 Tax=Allomyces macrogynus (strain ATCC 38327) TaxID=578462 RepID=A0A0L0T4V4_ALLM3|nr:hypothetical protein AMAG_14120 [Allomyces macrogynus ATCC 38327]|eukprot:KNE69559.1 hypothetical protein AMAG_14120 [Allomyces macrogynus ATCC 38327]